MVIHELVGWLAGTKQKTLKIFYLMVGSQLEIELRDRRIKKMSDGCSPSGSQLGM